MQKSDVIGDLILLFISVWAILGGIKLHLGNISEPQPGFFPFWGGVALAVLCGIHLFQAWSGRTQRAETFGAVWRPLTMMMGLVLYVTFLNSLGYLLATIILSVVLLRVLGTRRVWSLALAALIMALGSYILFDRLLNVTLPAGILSRFL
jgi:putative tricarboxylic transport membrane protein